jgi:hypothetical protein
MIHEGGCLCRAVRYRVKDEPVRASVCHCRNCQRRTGSAFGIGAYLKDGDVEIEGELKSYEYRSDESGRSLQTQFCPVCGTTVSCYGCLAWMRVYRRARLFSSAWRNTSQNRPSEVDPP